MVLVGTILATSVVSLAYAQTATTPAATTVVPMVKPADDTTVTPSKPVVSAASVQETVVMLPRQASGQTLSSTIVGAKVYGMSDEKIGDVNDLILSSDGSVVGVIVGVGGFLGMDEKKVAVTYASIVQTKDSKGARHLALHVTKEALKAAVAFEPAKQG